ncbi:hypothetical protein THAOC_04029 [Thalassiosira oceanica]|uniref:Mitochondrial splicing suppressor 51-like C-terminal domain-containing protein n=1 Tax=Thalassiosira oceanica TaxID=159749 RepID=K0TPA3_THAOC|nr:hypothetical protein THAOC_04029 [Thalassiosira oceanica]|eukprot:EJK74302.1 hypothetical protein THAOC_04029 [Thalassiosira oceanica]
MRPTLQQNYANYMNPNEPFCRLDLLGIVLSTYGRVSLPPNLSAVAVPSIPRRDAVPMYRLGGGCCFKRFVPRRRKWPRRNIADAPRASASHADPACHSREFARRHTRAAAAALAVPPPSSACSTQVHPFENDQPTTETTTLEDYLQWRGWDMKATLEEYELGSSYMESAVGLVSHPLTFPLTLGRFVSQEFAGTSLRKKLRVCVVGARAEVTLPVQYWRELLVVTMNQNIDFQIDFVGPDVPLKSSTVRRVPLVEGSEHSLVMEMRFKQAYLHRAILDEVKSSKDNGSNTPDKNQGSMGYVCAVQSWNRSSESREALDSDAQVSSQDKETDTHYGSFGTRL